MLSGKEIFPTVDNGTDDLMNLPISGGGRGPSLRNRLRESRSSLFPQRGEGRSGECRSSRLAQGTGDAAGEMSVGCSFLTRTIVEGASDRELTS
jgi:hypothetical protein